MVRTPTMGLTSPSSSASYIQTSGNTPNKMPHADLSVVQLIKWTRLQLHWSHQEMLASSVPHGAYVHSIKQRAGPGHVSALAPQPPPQIRERRPHINRRSTQSTSASSGTTWGTGPRTARRRKPSHGLQHSSANATTMAETIHGQHATSC